MQTRNFLGSFALSMLFAATAFAQATNAQATKNPAIVPPTEGAIGRNLEAFTNLRLTAPVHGPDLHLTVTSDDPSRLVFAKSSNEAGSKTLELTIRKDRFETEVFYLQAIGSLGPATYTVSAPGYQTVKGKVEIARSAILMGGPGEALAFKTTSRTPKKITLYTAVLDNGGKVADRQAVAGGLKLKLDIASSDDKVGAVAASPLTLSGGDTTLVTQFKPVAPGTTVLTASVPEGFEAAKPIEVTVALPGLALAGWINIGKNLQDMGYAILGEDAPAGGLDITITSEDPTKLVLSSRADQLGSQTLKLHIPAGEGKAPYYIQALSDSGTVNTTAVAKGYRTRPTPINLMPSGLMVVYAPYGPPDEGEYFTPRPMPNQRPLYTSLSDHKQLWLTVWSVYLDPQTHRGADVTAQRLRPGLSVKVDLKNSDPTVASVTPSVTLSNAASCAYAQFLPLHKGETVLSIDTPPDFATPSNATSVKATVAE